MTEGLSRRLAAEFIGTAFLLATVVGSGIMGETLSGGNVAIALLANALATAAILYVLITMFGPISGAHFNPAVTLAMSMEGDIRLPQAILYAVAQASGAIAGVWLAHAMFGFDLLQASLKVRTGTGQWISEAVATGGLVLTILATRRSRPDAVAASVALYILAAYWFTASTSFANPAVTIARSLTNTFSGIRMSDGPVFVVIQLAAAAGAAYGHRWLSRAPVSAG